MLLTIEKVVILKSVDIFSDTPEELLVEVASILDEIEFGSGENIVEKGDIGRSMFIIVDGKVQVHDGGQSIAELGERDIFGEMAILDPEPRMATVTALEDTHVFRLSQDSLYELMGEHVEVAYGIIRMLCRRLRGAQW